MNIRRIGLWLLFILSIQCSKKATEPSNGTGTKVEDLLVEDSEISGWQRYETGWVANSDTELFTHMDGAAPTYIQYGFVEGAEQIYQGNVKTTLCRIQLYVFDQGDPSNAEALFDWTITTLSTPEDWQTTAFTDVKIQRFPVSSTIVAWKSKYYILLSIDSNLTDALEVLKVFAGYVGEKIR